MLTEYNKFISKCLKGGKMTMKEAAKLWKNHSVTFKFGDVKIDNKAAIARDQSHDFLIKLVFNPHSVQTYKDKKIVKKVFKDGEFAVSIDSLYGGTTPRGTARQTLCVLLRESISRGLLREEDNISLLAIGDVDGSYIKLIKMYLRMGFEIYGTGGIVSDIFEDLRLDREPEELGLVCVMMGMPIRNLLNWCDRFTKTSLL